MYEYIKEQNAWFSFGFWIGVQLQILAMGSIHDYSRSHFDMYKMVADSKSASSFRSLSQLLLKFLFGN